MNSGKNSEMGNHVDNATEDNVSDLADFYLNTSTQDEIHNSGLFPTKTAFPSSCTCNEMLSL